MSESHPAVAAGTGIADAAFTPAISIIIPAYKVLECHE